MGRSEREFANLLLVEQPNGDFALTLARQLFFDAYQSELWQALTSSTDPTLAGVAGKAVKEAAYHFRFSSDWVVRLGDGTDESHRRMQQAIDQLWRFTGEMSSAIASTSRWPPSGSGATRRPSPRRGPTG